MLVFKSATKCSASIPTLGHIPIPILLYADDAVLLALT